MSNNPGVGITVWEKQNEESPDAHQFNSSDCLDASLEEDSSLELSELEQQEDKNNLYISIEMIESDMQSASSMNNSSGGDPEEGSDEACAKEQQQQQPHPSNTNTRDDQDVHHHPAEQHPRRHQHAHHHDPDHPTSDNNNSKLNQRVIALLDLWQTVRLQCGEFVNHANIQIVMVFLIAVNALMIGIGTFEFVKDNPTISSAFDTTDMVFLIIFTIELGLQSVYRGWRLVTDPWLVFDFVIIVTSWAFSELQIIRAFRIFRALRLITRIKVMQNLVLALFGVIPRMFAIWLLLVLVSYIFAVMFTQLFKDLYERELTDIDYFGRIDKTLFTLFQIMTLDAWADVCREVMAVYSWAWLPIITYVIVTAFVVVNLVIAVICDAVSALHDDEQAKLFGGQVSVGTDAAEVDVREQLHALEHHVDELTQLQEETLQTIMALTQQLTQANSKMLVSANGKDTSSAPVEYSRSI